MNKKFLSAILFGALMVTSTGTFVSCKDYDDEIDEINSKIDKIETTLADLKSQIGTAGVTSVTFDEATGILTVVTDGTSKTYTVKTAAPTVDEVKITIDGKDLKVNDKVVGQVGDSVEVKNNELYINNKATGIKVGQYAILDNQSAGTVTITLPDADGKLQTVELMKASAALSSVQIEDLSEAAFGNSTMTGGIEWGTASIAYPNWGGPKGAITRNQLMVGQIGVVNVQVTPASYDLGAQALTLVDSKGNVAPVNVTATANNRLLPARSASANGSWTLSIEMTSDVTAGNIAGIFDYDDASSVTGPAMAYTLCVNGTPYTTYDLSVKPSNTKSTNNTIVTVPNNGSSNYLNYVGMDGRVKATNTTLIPVGSTQFFFESINLYDSYITFEGTNKSLAEQYNITVGSDGMTLNVPANATGVVIEGTVHTMAVNGYESAVTTNKVTFRIAGATTESQTIAATTHEIKPAATVAEVLKNIRVDLGDVFTKIPAATREAVRKPGQFELVEAKNQAGFIVNSTSTILNNSYNVFSNVSYLKADKTAWTAADDILDLRYIDLKVQSQVAADAKPGNYQLALVVMDENYISGSGNISGNEIIKINMPVNVTVPSFNDMFEKTTAEWNTAKTEFNARIYIDATTNNPYLRLGEAFNKTSKYDGDYQKIVYAIKYINGKSPVTNDRGLSTEEGVATISTDGYATLDKNIVYNTAGNALKETSLAGMKAYYPIFYQATQSDLGLSTNDDLEAVQEAFTVASDAYASKLITPLNGIAISSGDIILDGSGKAAVKIKLDSSTLDVKSANIAPAATSGLTNSNKATYTLLPSTNVASANKVNTLFEIASGATVTVGAAGIEVNGLTGLSTLKVTFTDATGLVYTSSVQIQPVK